MNLTPKRKHGEPFAEYRRRRALENKAVEHYLRLGHRATIGTRRKLGKAATKEMKRARRCLRESRAT